MRGTWEQCAVIALCSGLVAGATTTANATSSSRPGVTLDTALTTDAATSLSLPPANYKISLDGHLLELKGGLAVGGICPTSFVNPDTMQVVSVAHHSCNLISFTGAPNVALDVTQNPGAVSIRVERTDPATHEVTLGPVLMTLEEWNWGHSGTPVAGDGSVWVYGYDANASQLLELSATTGRPEHRFRLDAGLVPTWQSTATDSGSTLTASGPVRSALRPARSTTSVPVPTASASPCGPALPISGSWHRGTASSPT